MKIGIISDLHMDYSLPFAIRVKNEAIESLLDEINCLVMCGDNAVQDSYTQLFEMLRSNSQIPIGFVTGNHCLFGEEGYIPADIEFKKLNEKFKEYTELAKKFDIVHLEEENLIFDGVTISGTYGHYDGSFKDRSHYMIRDYRTVSQLLSNLSNRIGPTGKRMLITHTSPNPEMSGSYEKPGSNFFDFAGSRQIEKFILQKEPDWHFCGHSHVYAESQIGKTKSFSLGTDYDSFFYYILDTKDFSLQRLEKKVSGF